ncbi:acyl-ACP desaturase [Streptomyces monticola]|uniref:Acyl-ACP desaturase n=1 Tax=Streptomyces monticola TaxID=2666263 RepID=A0ABW2JF15_9ACTN
MTREIRPAGGPMLAPHEVEENVATFMRATPVGRRWDVESIENWELADAGRLTEGQRSAVRFVTLIEDHLPGYFAQYHEHFPVTDDVEPQTYMHNRELYHFTVRWAAEEDTHARALARYQTASGLAEPEPLRAELAQEGSKRFSVPYEHAVQYFAYTLVQEKATQIYYQQLRDVVSDPVLKDLLGRLSRDEARHFAFMADTVELYVRRFGDRTVEPIREVIADFRMPLADTMRGYWRWALRIADTARYDHTDAYEHLVRVVSRAVETRSDKMEEMLRFVTSCRTVAQPAAR